MSDQNDNGKGPGDDLDFQEGLVLPGDESFSLDSSVDDREGDYNGLEADDRQSAEIREIFGTAFPQYLQPVEEIVDQIFRGEGDDDSQEALSGMISSLMEASSRMGFDNIHELLNRLNLRIMALDEDMSKSVEADDREGILYYIEELKNLAGEMGGQPQAEPQKRERTIVEALKNKEGVGNLVLRRLSTAGLITVEQLLMARPDEISAVSGLEIEIVHHILSLLSEDASLGSTPASLEDEGLEQMPAEVDSLHDEILEKLRKETETEASIESLKVGIRTLRTRISEHRALLQSADMGEKEKKGTHNSFTNKLTKRAAVLAKLVAKRNALAERHSLTDEAIREKEVRLRALKKEKRSITEKGESLNREVNGLVDRIGRLRKSFARGRILD